MLAPQTRSDAAAKEREAACKARAMEIREWEKRMAVERKRASEAETARKKELHEQMEEAKLVPDNELAKADDPEAGPLAMFTRFFGFRKRGSGHHLSSVAP